MTEQTIEELLTGRKSLYIPIVSMRDYETGVYDLAKDGNVNRMISKLSKAHRATITITLPRNTVNDDFLINSLRWAGVDLTIERVDMYGKNAGETRNNPAWLPWLKEVHDEYDMILFEPNIITMSPLTREFPKHFAYWLPVSCTSKTDPSFVEGFKSIDIEASTRMPTYVLSKRQQELMPGAILDNSNLFNPDMFDVVDVEPMFPDHDGKLIFHPFRQSDAGYKTERIVEAIDFELVPDQYLFAYTAPNGYVVDEIKDGTINSIKVSSNRSAYYSLLASKPCIIYLEDPDDIMHISILEFIHFGCPVIHFKNSLFESRDPKLCIESLDQLEEAIRYATSGESNGI